MRGLSLRLAVAIITFTTGVIAASVWFVRHHSAPTPVTTGMCHFDEQALVTQGRDLSLYDFGGRQCGATILISETQLCEAAKEKARAFIWGHWQEKRRGYIIIQFAYDDRRSDAHLFIEPDGGGSWHGVWRQKSLPVGYFGEIEQFPDIRSIEQGRADNNDIEPAGTPILVFRDKDGRKFMTF